ncbi:MAG: hypothetical protein DRQ35_07030, partial [Gammaproteobacteria bacterium]
MEIELQEIADFVITIPPFDHLPAQIITQLIKKMSIRYIRRGTELLIEENIQNRLYLLRKGAISLLSEKNQLLGKLGEGDICTAFCQLQDKEKFTIHVEEDTLVYSISCQAMTVILDEYPDELAYFQETYSKHLNQSIESWQGENNLVSTLMQTPISDIMHHPVITADVSISIRDAAIIMTENNVSSLILLKENKVSGLLTDKDITKRCIARDISRSTRVDQIMTAVIVSSSMDVDAFEAMMIMSRKQIRHLPIIEHQKLCGIISISDFLRLEGRNSVYISNAIGKADSIEEIQEHCQLIPQ